MFVLEREWQKEAEEELCVKRVAAVETGEEGGGLKGSDGICFIMHTTTRRRRQRRKGEGD